MIHFIDVGANVGQTFDEFLSLSKRFDGAHVWCLEPSPRHLPELMERCKLFSYRYSITVCPFGMRGKSEVVQFYEKDDPRGDSFEFHLASDHLTANVNRGFNITAFAVGVAEFILNATDDGDEVVLKLDCEGSEFEILAALLESPAALARVSRILVEWHLIGSEHKSGDELSAAYAAAGVPLERWAL